MRKSIAKKFSIQTGKSMLQLRIILMKAEMPGISDVCLKNATCSSC